jgi:hypothetical protein
MVQRPSIRSRAGVARVKAMKIHLLPSTHPARGVLETIFHCSTVIDNEPAFREAGFEIRVKKKRSLMRVATHPELPEYVIKVFFASELQCEREKARGWKGFAARCEGAERIRQIIQERRIQHFHVPRKWLFYPPQDQSCSLDDQPAILLAEYQDLASRRSNEDAWFRQVTESHLNELYAIIEGAGGASYRPDNIPLTLGGHFAFIDTEHSSESRDYDSIMSYLAPRMRQYWIDLVTNMARLKTV